MHENQVDVTLDTVRQLIEEQFVEFQGQKISRVDSDGTENAIFRIGGEYTARFLLHDANPDELRSKLGKEAKALDELAEYSTVATPKPVFIGEPSRDYPMPWAVQTWIDGTIATREDPANSNDFAIDLARFIQGLRAADTQGRSFAGRGRGGQLTNHDEWMEECLEKNSQFVDTERLGKLWRELRVLPSIGPDVMSHRDLHPGNMLVQNGRIVGVLDGGGFGPADRALDLVSGWHLLDEAPRATLRNELDCSNVEWARGMAWALEQAMGLVWYYAESNPTQSKIGMRTLNRILSATQ